MNRLIKQKWVEELRSKKHRKIIKSLTDCNGGFCSLGVLCNTIDPTKWEGLHYRSNLYISWNDIPHDLAKEIGISARDRSNIIHRNDNLNLSFEEIADYIEQYISEE